MKIIIAAAGTGGHINPGIAIANKICELNKNTEVYFIGTKRGLENDLVPKAGYKLKTIEAYGISRKISFNNVKNIIKTLNGYKKTKKIVKKINPDLVIGTGGYICGPVLKAAQSLKIPTVLHESNAFPGAAVKLLCKKTDLVLVGFEDTVKRLPKAKNIIVSGNPTKVKKINYSENEKKKIIDKLGLKMNKPIVLIFGGSQGAKTINEALIKIINNKMNNSYQIIWATGNKQYDLIKNELNKDNIDIKHIENMKILPYIYNMEEIMNISDVIVARSGAMTITEIAKLGKPAIFIPFPFATENHQEYNARVLVNANAAKLILDKDLEASNLNETINNMIKDRKILDDMGRNAEKVSIENVEDKIYNEIMKILK